MRHHQFELAARFERRTAAEHLVEDDADRVEVAALIQAALAFDLLRGD